MVSFYAFPEIFIDTVGLTASKTFWTYIFFQKGHPNQNGGCPDTVTRDFLATKWLNHSFLLVLHSNLSPHN